jgi:hypothetical protein
VLPIASASPRIVDSVARKYSPVLAGIPVSGFLKPFFVVR